MPSKQLTPKTVLRDAAKKPAPVYLFVGEPYQTDALARRLVSVLVPDEKRGVNLETYEGRTTPISTVLDSCRTLGLFGGGKVVWVREPSFLASSEKRADISAAMFTAWSAERRKAAAEKLLTLAALAGWSQEDFESASFSELNKTKAKALLGKELDKDDARILDQLRDHSIQAGLTVAAQRDEGTLLEEFLDSGTAGDTVLIFTAAAADKRKKVYKDLQKRGITIELTIDRERSGALTADAVGLLIDDAITAWGKSISPAAKRLIAKRAGSDPAPVNDELEKLCLYAGDRSNIEEDDVRLMMRDLGESWIFDFTGALAQRKPTEALQLLRGLFAQGEPPLRVMAMIARELRILLAAREILSTSLSGMWNDRTQFNRFRDHMLPRITEQQKQALGNMHPYVLYLALQNAGRTTTSRLQRALLDLHDLDIALKSSRASATMRLEAFIIDLTHS